MKTHDTFPVGTATGACLITLKSDPRKVGRIVDIDRDLEDLPAWGRICISERGVALLAEQLKMKLVPKATLKAEAKEEAAEIDRLRAERDELLNELDVYRGASLVFADQTSPASEDAEPAPETVSA